MAKEVQRLNLRLTKKLVTRFKIAFLRYKGDGGKGLFSDWAEKALAAGIEAMESERQAGVEEEVEGGADVESP